MWKTFWKKAPLCGILMLMIVVAMALDFGLGTGYIIPKAMSARGENANDQEDSSLKPVEEASVPQESEPAEESSRIDGEAQENDSKDPTDASQVRPTENSNHNQEPSREESSENSSEGSDDSGTDDSQESSQQNAEESSLESSETSEASGESSEGSEESKPEKPRDDEEEEAFSVYVPFAYVDRAPSPPVSEYYDDPQRTALDTPANYFDVDSSYFENALFIGDSRIEGLALYGGMNYTSFLYMHGISVYTLEKNEDLVFKYQGQIISTKATEDMVLSEYQFDKIFIMLGINEVGIGTPDSFAAQYKLVLDHIREYQPNATIFVLGILNVTEEYQVGQGVFNNDNINSRNYRLAQLADGFTTFYIDCNPSVCDPESGALSSSYSSDGVHLRTEYYYLWRDYLFTKGIDPENPH